ncbi:apolipoprotein N-acyltransferase [Tomitella gaofuii]|uniref:apolipoprotein N-acyltransferase n=1 Tax=Tomitella gaofuii TaxID=2760083 RepID=UPI0015FCC96D|nr:apolipoprotein N-acyltransferase [Tomitella gaofuii]
MSAPARLRHFALGWTKALPRQVLAVGGGLLIFASYPPRTAWYLAPVGIALAVLAVTWPRRTPLRDAGGRPSLWGGFGYGFLAGAGFLLPLLPWVGLYVGPVPWLALVAAESLFVGVFGLAVAVLHRWPATPAWLRPFAVAACWSGTEWLRSSVPFGGFPWGRLAFGQPDGILLSLASLGGAPLLSFAVALVGAGVAAAVVITAGIAADRRARPGERPARPVRRTRIVAAAGALTAIALPLVAGAARAPFLPGMDSGERQLTVAAVQGNVPRLGLGFNDQRRAVLDMHVRRTLQLADDVDAGREPRPDIVLWPENSSDIDPLRNPDAAREISYAADRIGAPILVGAVLNNGDGTTTNSVIVWNPGTGPADRHDKAILQPFGEYMPFRDFFRHFSSYVDQAGHFVPGHGDGVITADNVPIAVATCYEIAFDRAYTTAVRAGGQFLAAPTNNATFSPSEMTYQQLAMTRVRAAEHGRAAVVAATTGVSAIIAPDGTVTQRTGADVPAALVSAIPLRTELTPATVAGPWPEYVLSALGAVAVAASAGAGLRRRSAR